MGLEPVAIGIDDEGRVVIRAVVGADSRLAVVAPAGLQALRVEAVDRRTILGGERDVRAGSGSGSTTGEVQSLQKKMLSDKGIMNLIHTLQDDPDFNKVLEDPEIMKAIDAGDVAALQANPRFMNLLNSATVKEIEKKLK